MGRVGFVRGAALPMLLGMSPATASPFDGRWRIDDVKRSPRTDVFVIRDGMFRCASCALSFAVPADGAFHAVTGQDDLDETSVTVVDAHAVRQINRINGRVVRNQTVALAADGKSAVLTFTDTINPGVAPVAGRQVLVRVAAAPPGSHALSGGWQPQAVTNVSEHALTQSMKIDGDVLTLRTGEGFSFVARLDGTPAPTSGDPFVDTVEVKRVSPRELTEVDKHQGTPVATFAYVVSPDGSTLTTTWRNQKTGRITSTIAHRI